MLKKTWKKPDIRVEYFRSHLDSWLDNDKNKLQFAIALQKTGFYKESLFLSQQLLFSSKLSFWDRGKNYINIAQNYEEFNLPIKARYYYNKALSRKNQYYYFLVARFEEYQKNYHLSTSLYQKANTSPFKEKEYIKKAYSRALYKAIIYYKYCDKVLYKELMDIIKNNPHLRTTKIRIVEKAYVFNLGKCE